METYYSSIFNEVFGPVMVGTSSSHTAGPYRIGAMARMLLKDPVKKGRISFDPNSSYTNMFLLQHSEYIPELLIESEEKYRFYEELKRSVNNAKINKDADNIGFEYEDVQFIFTGGNILAIKEGKIVEKRAISDFARRPADTYRRLRMAITYPDMDV